MIYLKKVFLFICFLLLTNTFITDIYAADAEVMTPGELPENTRVNDEYNNEFVDKALKESTDEVEILKAVLLCVRDIDIYVQYFITIAAGIFIFWITIWKPLMVFLQ